MITEQATWYNTGNGDLIGIVECTDPITKEIKYYIGIGEGDSEEQDIKEIKEWGAKFYPEVFKND